MLNEKEYLANRVSSQKKYFSSKSKKYKNFYYSFSITKIILTAGISLISLILGECSMDSIIIASLSFLVTILQGIDLVYKYGEKWLIFRKTNEELKAEEMFFITGTEKYYQKYTDEKFNEFVINFEELIKESNNLWLKDCKEKGRN